jgi:hypothetical protein
MTSARATCCQTLVNDVRGHLPQLMCFINVPWLDTDVSYRRRVDDVGKKLMARVSIEICTSVAVKSTHESTIC